MKPHYFYESIGKCKLPPEVLVGGATLVDTTDLEIKIPGEASSTFIRASQDPKGETQFLVANSTKLGPLRPKTNSKHFPNKSKTTLKKSRNRLF